MQHVVIRRVSYAPGTGERSEARIVARTRARAVRSAIGGRVGGELSC
jgi:hypothetical protein